MAAAITRRLQDELGVTVARPELILPGFGYRAVMANGVVENELCPVYRAIAESRTVRPAPDEVADAWWQPWADFVAAAPPDDPRSPWSDQQVAALVQLGPDPLRWPVADPGLLPAAAVA
jgi:isopentenyl-diphosphate Delta-isomerase